MSGLIALDIILSIWAIADVGLEIMSSIKHKRTIGKYNAAEKEFLIAEAEALKALLYAEMHKTDICNETSADRCKNAYDNLYTTVDNFKYWWKE